MTEIGSLSQATERDVQRLQVKLTYVGSQTKSMPSLAFSTYLHIVEMSWFSQLRRPGLNYANDESNVWTFSVEPAEMLSVVTSIRELDLGISDPPVDAPVLSLTLALRDSPLGSFEFEAVMPTQRARTLVLAIRECLDPGNGLARRLLDRYRELTSL